MKKKFHPFAWGANAFVFGILLGLGLNLGFVAETMASPIFPPSFDWIKYLFAVVFGLLVSLGSYGLYLYSELAYRAITTYGKAEFWLRLIALLLLNASMIALDIAGMLFRVGYLSARGVGWLVVVGVVCAFLPPLIGLVLPPISNKPVELLEEEMADDFARTTITETFDHLLEAPTHMKRRALGGAMDDVVEDVIEDEKEEAERAREELAARKIDQLTRREAFKAAINPSRKHHFTQALPEKQTSR